MHHVHISTTALIVAGLFLSAIIAVIVAGIVSVKRDRRRAEALRYNAVQLQSYPQHNAMTRDGHWPAAPDTYAAAPANYRSSFGAAPVAPIAYAPVASMGYGMDPSLALVEGMLIGEALGGSHHHDTTIIHDAAPAYDGSYDAHTGNSYDSGISYDSGSSSSSDFGSSSGVDISW